MTPRTLARYVRRHGNGYDVLGPDARAVVYRFPGQGGANE